MSAHDMGHDASAEDESLAIYYACSVFSCTCSILNRERLEIYTQRDVDWLWKLSIQIVLRDTDLYSPCSLTQ